MYPTTIKNKEDYLALVNNLANLADNELKKWEVLAATKDEENLESVAHNLPQLISIINTVGCLRGQDNTFEEIGEKLFRFEITHDIRVIEDALEKRLNTLIHTVLTSPKKEYYIKKLNGFFVLARSEQVSKDLETW